MGIDNRYSITLKINKKGVVLWLLKKALKAGAKVGGILSADVRANIEAMIDEVVKNFSETGSVMLSKEAEEENE